MKKRVLSLLLTFVMVLGMLPGTALAAEGGGSSNENDYLSIAEEDIAHGRTYLEKQTMSAFGNEWTIFTTLRVGGTMSGSDRTAYLESVKGKLDSGDALSASEYARLVLTLGVMGEDPTDFEGYDLVAALYENADLAKNLVTVITYVLIALDSKDYVIPADAAWTRGEIVDQLLSYQAADGGFGWKANSEIGDVDTTGMILTALAPYYNETYPTVQTAFEKALGYLKAQLTENAGYAAYGSENSCTAAQVLTALAAAGIDPVNAANGFTKDDSNLITNLHLFRNNEGGFLYQTGSANSDTMSTQQTTYALEAYRRLAAGENALFDLTDVSRSARSALENRLKEANSLIEGDYTEESWAAMAAARAAAQDACDNEAVSEEDLMEADRALAEAISGLEKTSEEPGSGGSDGSIQVYVTLSNAGQVVVAQKAVTVTDYNGNGGFDVDDALYAAHRAAYPGGASNGYASAEVSITKLWGDTSGCFGYWLNNASCGSLGDAVEANDHLAAFVYQDGAYWSDSYSKFDSYTYSARTGESVSLTLENAGYDENWNTVFSPLAGASIAAYDSGFDRLSADSYTVTDNGNGTYSAVFSGAGTYYLAAYCDDPLIVPAVCQVTVTSAQSGGGTGGGSRVTASISVKDPQGKTYLAKTSYTMAENSTVYDLLKQTGLELTTTNYGSGVYVKAIEGLGEFDQGARSGWMYRVNGTFPEISCDACILADGDYVEWLYTRELGGDIGGGTSSGQVGDEDRAAANAVGELIDAIGTVTENSGDRIAAARAAYDALTDTQKKLVTNYARLTGAEIEYAKLTGKVPFTDVDDHWAYEAIRYVYEQGLMSGTSSTAFSPELTTTRGMIVTILYALEGRPAVPGDLTFTDVSGEMYCADAVKWAENNGIVSGYGEESFGPNDPITREQLAVILYQYSAYKKYDVAAKADLSKFTDTDQIASWSFDALAWANAKHMMNGMENRVLAPRGNATRAQAAMILMCYLENVVSQG